MPDITPHDWFRPKLVALVAEAEAAGIARDVSVAVITDLINGPEFSTGQLKNEEGWNQDIGEPDALVNENDPTSSKVQDGISMPDPLPFTGGNRWV